MRWLFLFVLVLNIAYVAWEFNQPAEVLELPKADRDAPKIVLLSEIGQSSVAAPVVPVEETVSDADDKTETETAQSEQEPVVAKEESCFTLGPFRELGKLRAMTRAIKDYVADASFRTHEEKQQEMFWVYLKPSESYDKAKALSLELKKKKVKDYFIVSSGEQMHGISLGHFREKNRAYTHAKHIESLGFSPKVEPIFKTYTIFWLDYEVASGKTVPENIFEKHLTGKINRLVRDCS
ncbi:MAG: hypothetical protein OQK69_11840 [Gammaproteobacteria bacterium]|nr:hypothetical protein [Gammaproteobacteria bacterium]